MRRARLSRPLAPVFVCLACWAASCGGRPPDGPSPSGVLDTTLTPVVATQDWPSSTIDAQRLNRARLGDLAGRIRRGDFGRITSLLIARNGRLVVEEYFNGWSRDRLHTMQSITKSVTSLLAGIAARRGLSVNDPVISFFAQYEPFANLDAPKRAMTVRDLLTMQTGLDWDEDTYASSPLQRLNDCRCDWLRFVLDWRMRDQPGTRWQYNSGGAILLGGIIGTVSGSRLDRFADAELFGPLGVPAVSWAQGLPDGLPHSGGGLFLRPRDAAKIGELVLEEGTWQGRQVVAHEWIQESTRRAATGVRSWAGHAFDYGYYWWLTADAGGDIVTASGARGQWIFIVPRLQLVVVSTADNDDDRSIAAVSFLFSHVLPAAE